MPATKHSATTYLRVALVDNDTIASAEASRAEAVKRLGGSEINLVSLNVLDDNSLGVTWRREWEEVTPEPQAEKDGVA